MKNKRLYIVALILILAGLLIALGAMVAMGFDFDKLNNVSQRTDTVKESFHSVRISTDSIDVRIEKSSNEKCTVTSKTIEKITVTPVVKNGVLVIECKDERAWYDYIGISNAQSRVVVSLPEAQYNELNISLESGDVSVARGLTFAKADIGVSSGDVTFRAGTASLTVNTESGDALLSCNGGSINASVTSGDITVENTRCANLTLKTQSGDVELENVTAQNANIKTRSGDIEAEGFIVDGELRAEVQSGDIDLDMCDATTLVLTAQSGDISGTLLSEKIFFAESSSGDVSVPKTTSGGTCQVTTGSGDIKFIIK
ncbi:MAG: DUF4097 family beta strand repeat protein [Clostridia bacterium]|nr:DUF4097 family beta strand repeat protein [Clostridia bacterium]